MRLQWLIIALVSLSICNLCVGDGKEEEKPGIDKLLIGRFDRASDPHAQDFKELLETMEFKEGTIELMQNISLFSVDFSKKEDGRYVLDIHHKNLKEPRRQIFLPGEQFDAKLSDGRRYNVTVDFEGDNTMIRNEVHPDFTCRNVYVFDEAGFDVTYECKDKKASQRFKKIV